MESLRSKYYYMLRKLKLNQDNQGQNENKQKQENPANLNRHQIIELSGL